MTFELPPQIAPSLFESVVDRMANAQRISAFTGAGVSAESGIPTFRDAGGLWEQFDPIEIGTPGGLARAFVHHASEVHRFLRQTWRTFRTAQPNPGHLALAKLEAMGLLTGIVTQNIDDLHRIAGSKLVLEVHGNIYRFRCLFCHQAIQYTRESILSRFADVFDREQAASLAEIKDAAPDCPNCMGLARPDVVLFGEAVQHMDASYALANATDIMLVVGASGAVYPAANVPHEAKRHGAVIIEVNPGDSAFEGLVDIHLNAPSGLILPLLTQAIEARRK